MSSPRQFAEFRARRAAEQTLARLEHEIAKRTHRRHLDTLVELLLLQLGHCGSSLETAALRARAEDARARAEAPRPRKQTTTVQHPAPASKHPHLRLIK